MVQIFKNEAVIFDLDDLLFKEFDFMRSGFWEICRLVEPLDPKHLFRLMMAKYFSGEAPLTWLSENYLQDRKLFDMNALLNIYRNHIPDISLVAECVALLDQLKLNGNKLGLITDGRSVTQRNKIEALGLSRWIEDFSISEETGFEKPSFEPYLFFMKKYEIKKFIYIADNYNKDFIAPNKLGWRTIALEDNGLNIHRRTAGLSKSSLPAETIKRLSDLRVSASEYEHMIIK